MITSEIPKVTESLGFAHHFYLYEEIGPACDYVELIHTLESASPNDVIYIHINTPGGRLNTTVNIIQAMKECAATVVTCADGDVYSGGSLILFAGSAMRISDYCQVMIHDGSYGLGGKVNENLGQAMQESRRIKSIYEDIYYPFLTKKEIKQVLDGKDMYLNADEVCARVDRVVRMKEKQSEQE